MTLAHSPAYLEHLTFLDRFFDAQQQRIVSRGNRTSRRLWDARREAAQLTVDTDPADCLIQVRHAMGPKRQALSQLDREHE